jgi:hypothetical protein
MIAASENWNLLAFDHGSWMTYFFARQHGRQKDEGLLGRGVI